MFWGGKSGFTKEVASEDVRLRSRVGNGGGTEPLSPNRRGRSDGSGAGGTCSLWSGRGPAVGGSQRYAVPRRATAARVRASCVCDVAPGGHAPSRYGTNLSVLFLVAEYFQVTLLRSCPGCYGDET